jgi:hypothetical protein
MKEVTQRGLQQSFLHFTHYYKPLYLNYAVKVSDQSAVNSTAMLMFRLLDSIPLATLPNFSIQRPTKNISTTKIFTLKEWLSKGEIIAKMGSNKTGTLQRLKTKEPVGYFSYKETV